MSPEALESLRRAGRIAAVARNEGAKKIVAGASLEKVCEGVEETIRKLGGEAAFPAQTSVNHVAAHYCPRPGDPKTYEDGDLAKLDVGVHVNGYVVDTAVTVNVGDHDRNKPFIEAARSALDAAIRVARAGISIREISTVINDTVRSYGLRPMKNLCGHGVGLWTVHSPPPIPNAPEDSGGFLPEDGVLAIEPFATDGEGHVREEGEAEVFRLPPGVQAPAVRHPGVLEEIQAFRGLPFARRSLRRATPAEIEETLSELRRTRCLQSYRPLTEGSGRPVAQAEHTVWVSASGVEVLTL